MKYDMYSIFNNMFKPVLDMFWGTFFVVLYTLVVAMILFVVIFFVKYKINLFKLKLDHLANLKIKFLPYDLVRWLIWDFLSRGTRSNKFKPYGFTFFVGRQGSGKTISMVQYLNTMKDKYPNCLIVTNFSYSNATHRMTDWRDFLEIRNGEDGVIFAIDEIHSEYSSASWKDFPENLLSEISQQRKQKIKIVATSQVFSRVAKPLREQAFSVILCETFFSRYTRNREYDAAEFSTCSDNMYQVKKKVKALWKSSFVQSNYLRSCFDTYEKIERMKKVEFIPRHERLSD